MAREQAAAEAAAKIAAALGDACFEGDAHAFLMAVYKDGAKPIEVRLDAAKAAVGYEKPRLGSVEAKIDGAVRHTVSHEPLSDDEWERQYGAGGLATSTGAAEGSG